METSDSFVPDPLSNDDIAVFPDSQFEEFFSVLDDLRCHLRRSRDARFLRRLFFVRDAQMFSPRFSSAKSAETAYIVKPFVPFTYFDSIEALTYARANQLAWDSAANGVPPYTEEFLGTIHGALLPDKPWSGRFRDLPAWIGRKKTPAKDALIVLAPSRDVRPAFNHLVEFATNAGQSHRLATCAMIHYQLVAIHPFSDGNGRIARIVTPLLLDHFHLIDDVCLFVSEILLHRRVDYFARIESVERYGEIQAWVLFFVECLVAQARAHKALAQLAGAVKSELKDTLRSHLPQTICNNLINEMILSPTMNLSRIATLLKTDSARARIFFECGALDRYQINIISRSQDPVYQVGALYELFAV